MFLPGITAKSHISLHNSVRGVICGNGQEQTAVDREENTRGQVSTELICSTDQAEPLTFKKNLFPLANTRPGSCLSTLCGGGEAPRDIVS